MLQTLGDQALYCASFLFALNRLTTPTELARLTHYSQKRITRLLTHLEQQHFAVRVGQQWRIASRQSAKPKATGR